jgi:hypothetical protein
MRKINEDIKRIKNLMNIRENEDGVEDFFKQKYTGQSGAHDEDDMAPDGMDDDSDTNEEFVENEIYEDDATATTDTTTDTSSDTGVTVKKWESGRTFGKTYMNDPKYKWESGRATGPTYKGPNAKWESGIKRDKGNPVP